MKILFLTYGDCFHSPKNGGGQCNARNFRLLKEIYGQNNVFAACILDAPLPSDMPHIHYFPQNTSKLVRITSALTGLLECTRATQKAVLSLFEQVCCTAVFMDSLSGSWIPYFRKINPQVKFLLLAHNIDKKYYEYRVNREGKHLLPIYWGVCRNEQAIVRNASWFATLSERDSHEFAKIYGRAADVVLPMSFADKFEPTRVKPPSRKRELLFLGSLFAANFDGVCWFINEVLPLLPDFTLTIVGKDFEKETKRLSRPNVRVVGTVDDPGEAYYAFSMVVMPILYGTGIKIKTAEAFMYGKTIFATDEALEGYEVEGVKGIYRCNTAKEFASKIDTVFSQDNLPDVEPEVRKLFLSQYSNEIIKRKLQKSLQGQGLLEGETGDA